uniref:Uncharacterized protein n=1 Tax=Physcomitrium patens TaxID=3218 RepID=A0A2K1IY73_PHYPA|nr:hypothetical protein PHYPA_024041 [Physcomitrium patens]
MPAPQNLSGYLSKANLDGVRFGTFPNPPTTPPPPPPRASSCLVKPAPTTPLSHIKAALFFTPCLPFLSFFSPPLA